MSTKEFNRFRELLMTRRGEILDRIRGLQATLALLSEPEKEVEEQAQKISASHALDRLGADGRLKMELIDLALRKISLGDYGICESCEDDIAPRRLEAVPWTRLCVDCARDLERRGEALPDPEEVVRSTRLPEEYDGLTDQELLRRIHDQIDRVLEVDKSLLRIAVQKGVVYLEGSVEDEQEHDLIVQTLTEELGVATIVDTLKAEDSVWAEGEEELGPNTIH